MLETFQEIWYSRLGQIKRVNHWRQLFFPEAIPIHSMPYRAGPKAQKAEKDKIVKRLVIKFIRPATEKREQA